MFEIKPIEYRVIFHWDRDHWSCINASTIPVDIFEYFRKNLPEMKEAMEDSEDAYFSVECYAYGNLEHSWQGTPEELMKEFKEIADEWLSHAFE